MRTPAWRPSFLPTFTRNRSSTRFGHIERCGQRRPALRSHTSVRGVFTAISFDLTQLGRYTDVGLASVAAMSALPRSIHSREFLISMGSGVRAGEMGVAFGLSYRSSDDSATSNARISIYRDATTAAGGMRIEF